MAYIGKEYKFERQEKFDEFLKAVGVPEEYVSKIVEFKGSQKLLKDGSKYTYISQFAEGPKETVFESGVEFDDTIGAQKTPVKTTYTVDGNTVTQIVKTDKGSATFKRLYNGDELVVEITSDLWNGTAYRYYKA